jgi:hypothetical protein
MLMFENGLLASFIPEIFMVFGFVLCLFTPGFKAQNSSTEQTQVIVQVSTIERQQLPVYQVSNADFQQYAEPISEAKQLYSYFTRNVTIFESDFSTSDGLSYVDFSRPPPFFII